MARAKFDMAEFARGANGADPAAIAALKAENARLRKRLSVAGGVAELIQHAVEEAYQKPPDFRVPPPPKQPKHKEREIAVAHVSDTQIGKVTRSYDSEIAAGRLMEYAERTATCIERHRTYARIEELHVFLGGDLIEGESIFSGQPWEIDSGVLQQAVRTAPEIFARMIVYWLGVVDRIHVVGVAGNHGRSGRKGESHPLTNWDTVAMATTRLLVDRSPAASRVTWNLPDDWHAIDIVCGRKLALIHGDNLKVSNFGGNPFERRLLSWRNGGLEGAAGYDAIYFGHYHRRSGGTINDFRWFCNGSTESSNKYAEREFASSGMPVQNLHFYNEKVGLAAERAIYLTYGLAGKAIRSKRADKARA